MAVCFVCMEFEFRQDETNGDWICELVELTEPECDVARNRSVGGKAGRAGAVAWGTSYRRGEGNFSAHVRAEDKETAREAAEAYWDAIRDALDE